MSKVVSGSIGEVRQDVQITVSGEFSIYLQLTDLDPIAGK